ncbi:2-amino-4-hydroxy-6-hydroxymethyldihydropteridine diphosphokinase [Gimesia panareensis]|uniref:2-amino-4-hydroxy-6- hydroxymethyldihydropteridine diphosphokinase n=1 Tax=Gimesia panareensis TaxID=2527978 RepID=UPI001187D233|nr:2-amino-4-hydroxy-6-hydroxymethyldihydropteridine diphosphokinase [Gimesia panareensis]QDU50397.1 Bifunctional folate synthesis protein [Gimesia panareensis]
MSRLNQAFLALGSNIDPETHLPQAVESLAEYGKVQGKSSVWQSAPVGDPDQADFLNAAVLLETEHDATFLCEWVVPEIEKALNRVRDPQNKNGPRTIDLDLVLFNSEALRIAHRIIPDPEIVSRVFLAVPLAEIAPDYSVPGLNRTLADIALSLKEHAENQPLRRVEIQL